LAIQFEWPRSLEVNAFHPFDKLTEHTILLATQWVSAEPSCGLQQRESSRLSGCRMRF